MKKKLTMIVGALVLAAAVLIPATTANAAFSHPIAHQATATVAYETSTVNATTWEVQYTTGGGAPLRIAGYVILSGKSYVAMTHPPLGAAGQNILVGSSVVGVETTLAKAYADIETQ